MSADLNVIFASALAAKPVQRGIPCEGTNRWRDDLHFSARRQFRRDHSAAADRWFRRSRELTASVPPCDPRWLIWRGEFRAHLAMALKAYRKATPIFSRPSRAEAFRAEARCTAERSRLFGLGG